MTRLLGALVALLAAEPSASLSSSELLERRGRLAGSEQPALKPELQGGGDWVPFGTTTASTTAGPAAPRLTAEEKAARAEANRERAERLLEEATERGARQEEAARLHEEKVAREEAALAEKNAQREKRKKAQQEADKIREAKVQRRQLAKVEASDREQVKLKRREEREFEAEGTELEEMMRKKAQELEAQNAAKEWERKRNQARIRAEIFEKAKVTIAEARQRPRRRGGALAAALDQAKTKDLSDVVRDMSDSLKGGKLGPASKNANVEFEVSAADYALRSSELRETFVQESPNMDRDPARLLGKFLNDTIALNMEHDERSLELFTDLLSKMPTNAAKVSQPLVALLWPPPLHHPPLNSSAFRLAEGSGVCGQVANFHEAVAGFRANLTKVATMLNTTAVLLPRLPNAVPGASEEVTSFLDNMLRLSYIETIARDREASKLSRAISPAVMERLFCSAAAPLRLAGLAAASVAAAWLSSV
mmetsp:Transcript_93735/g.244158  ORF Transcript_93735/g.244158 Transcript_93735/m.244158 type:complete len:479 (+) Transcript_93735:47-1483(+)